ncbi:MAG: DNA-directed RNA polymerase subunit H [Nitrososphaerota archaeon]|jgi:DNA-directed RNA polymerase subunit H|nr:DNA-directed RNA polymerase subunit H [Nitrososphaerota archaeon]MDG7039828.1 DNA-directed RNA polymerase subunit H [Nitrososphaerota archaeon]MDG7041993.1 DNA-directed RNA polymerase subunit H [Nitrososphaerota archaeon]MDG7046056.1 DNA-directed RNA polymerase subunit H [Nitrososphaerota archaeon]
MAENNVDISKHVLVPEHEVINTREASKLLEEYHIEVEQLPRITTNDPMVKALNAKAGDIIKITRDSETAGVTLYYRYVVDE